MNIEVKKRTIRGNCILRQYAGNFGKSILSENSVVTDLQYFTWYSCALTAVTCWFWLLKLVMQLNFLPFSDIIRSSTDKSYKRSSCRFTRHEGTSLNGVLLTQFTLFNLGTRWKWFVSLTPRPVYPRGKNCSFHRVEPRLELRPVRKLSIKTKSLDVCLSVHRCICVEKKNQLDVTEYFSALMICSTCFGHFYAHHQELETICVLLPPMVCSAWLLVVGVRLRTAGCASRKRDAASPFLDA